MSGPTLGVVGGSGVYDLEGLEGREKVVVETPFGAPSAPYIVGTMGGQRSVFLPRHGMNHRLLPGEINYRANIYGFRKLGATALLSVSAVGSMKERLKPGEMLVVDQFIDRTRNRSSTFFGDGVVGHVPMADPVCPILSKALGDAVEVEGSAVHRGGTYICIEGPQFSTRAESHVYRSWDVDVIGMTNVTEAKLAREAGLCFATLAMITDYDCWHESEDDVSAESVLAIMKTNAEIARRIVERVITNWGVFRCPCPKDIGGSVVSQRTAENETAWQRLSLFLNKGE